MPTRSAPDGGLREAFAAAGPEETVPYPVQVPDLGAVLLRLSNGGTGLFVTSSLCAGHRNDLRFEVHGAERSLSWVQEKPELLWVGRRGEADQLLHRDPGSMAPAAKRYTSFPGGHNEGWPDALKNVLYNVFEFIAQKRDPATADEGRFPTFRRASRNRHRRRAGT